MLNGRSATVQGMLWMVATGLQFTVMNAILKKLSHEIDPWVVGWLRYSLGMLVMLPPTLRLGAAQLWPRRPGLQMQRGLFHSVGMVLWFSALPLISLAELTAISFSGPLFICLGAVLFLGERMTWPRWVAVGVGFFGVLLVVQPWQGGFGGITAGTWLMLAATPVFAGGFLTAKLLTRYDRPDVIVFWQHLWVSIILLPLAVAAWVAPDAAQWTLLIICGFLGAGGHYCTMRAFKVADISAVQSVRFLDLVWAALLGFAFFGAVPASWTVAGGVLTLFATLWLARRESRAVARAA